jgi:uncharacterized protein YbjT (DUF2867 family)
MGLALVTGATGYIGSRLVPELLAQGWDVRVLTRDADRITPRAWADKVEIVEGDATSADARTEACTGVDVLYYLLHSMDGEGSFRERDRQLAQGFGEAAYDAGVGRIVYLSGLHPDGRLSEHLASRVEVGDTLLSSGVPTAVLQAAMIVGAGSASYEMLRHLADRLPAMVAPSWLDNRIQPIAIGDVLHYLVASAGLDESVNRTFDVGGPDILTYVEMIQRYAEARGRKKPPIVTVPALPPQVASQWISFVTPVPSGVAKPLIESLQHDVVCQENELDEHVGIPPDGLTHFEDAVRRALAGDGRSEPGEVDPAQLTTADPEWVRR